MYFRIFYNIFSGNVYVTSEWVSVDVKHLFTWGWEVAVQRFIWRDSALRSNLLHFCIPFWDFERKCVPCIHLLLKKKEALSYNLLLKNTVSIKPWNKVNVVVLNKWNDTGIRCVFKIFLVESFKISKLTDSHCSLPEACKRNPFWAEPPHIAHYREEYPPRLIY